MDSHFIELFLRCSFVQYVRTSQYDELLCGRVCVSVRGLC